MQVGTLTPVEHRHLPEATGLHLLKAWLPCLENQLLLEGSGRPSGPTGAVPAVPVQCPSAAWPLHGVLPCVLWAHMPLLGGECPNTRPP